MTSHGWIYTAEYRLLNMRYVIRFRVKSPTGDRGRWAIVADLANGEVEIVGQYDTDGEAFTALYALARRLQALDGELELAEQVE
jgi:hypothetical protein